MENITKNNVVINIFTNNQEFIADAVVWMGFDRTHAVDSEITTRLEDDFYENETCLRVLLRFDEISKEAINILKILNVESNIIEKIMKISQKSTLTI